MTSTSQKLLQGWYRSVVSGRKNNTYKLALGLSLLKCAKQKIVTGRPEPISISYSEITGQWVEYYWDHTAVFRLKQAVSGNQIPQIITILTRHIEESGQWGVHWKKVESQEKKLIKDRVLTEATFIDNPISRLPYDHKTKHAGGDAKGSCSFYKWDKGSQEIELTPEFVEVIGEFYPLLVDIVVLTWSEFLERYNTVPGLIQKVKLSSPNRNLARLRRLFIENSEELATNICFYCNEHLREFTLDHVVPFSFVYTDDLFNLVPSCRSCNSRKNDCLPTSQHIERVIQRNMQLSNKELYRKEWVGMDGGALANEFQSLVSLCESAGFRRCQI